jgi:hypothetical protein
MSDDELPVNRARWNWLLVSYHACSEDQHQEIINGMLAYAKTSGPALSDDELLYMAMMDAGIQIMGEDPDPPKVASVTDAGAEEYAEIMSYDL